MQMKEEKAYGCQCRSKPVFPTFQIIFPFEKNLNCIFKKFSFFCQISVKRYFENIERENYNHLIIDNSVYY
jgi:hypothetical protein